MNKPTTNSRAPRQRKHCIGVTTPPAPCPSPDVGPGARDLVEAQRILMEAARTLHGVRSLLDSMPTASAEAGALRVQAGNLRNRCHMAARDMAREIEGAS